MNFSVGTLNAGLNAVILAVHVVLVLLTEHTYLLLARLQAHRRGSTSATNVAQLHLSHWVVSGLRRLWHARPPLFGGRDAPTNDALAGWDVAVDPAVPLVDGGSAGAPGGGAAGDAAHRGSDTFRAVGSFSRSAADQGSLDRGPASEDRGAEGGASVDRGAGHLGAADPGGGGRDSRGRGADAASPASSGGARSSADGNGGDAGADPPPSWLHRRRAAAAWVVLLAVGLVALIPAELFLESGLDTRPDCAPVAVPVADGVCASPYGGTVAVATSTAALLAARLDWIDNDWTVVPEGASKGMVAAEVRTGAVDGRRVLATDCELRVTPCEAVPGGCGSIEYVRRGAFRFVASRSSLQAPPPPPAAAVADGGGRRRRRRRRRRQRTGAFVFFDDPPAAAAAASAAATARARGGGGGGTRDGRYHIAVRGVEVALGRREGERVFAASRSESGAPLTLHARAPLRARAYALACATDGLTAADLAHALTVYRRMQLSAPGVLPFLLNDSVQALPAALTRNDALRAAFSLKAEDVTSVCAAETLVYAGCGSMDWWRAAPLGGIAIALVAVWAAAVAAASRVPPSVDVPTDATAWRRLAVGGHGGGGGAAAAAADAAACGKRSPTASWGPWSDDGGSTPVSGGSAGRWPSSVGGSSQAPAPDSPPFDRSRGWSPARGDLGAGDAAAAASAAAGGSRGAASPRRRPGERPAPRATPRGTVYWVVGGA
ncbi:hypothetical protein BU14_0352s0006 [Porphyra umbilicalis]|uniref:Uncharacterized protein n=1 Tax=Porphyra umbilicalis TaxID=2786 RepID=A0A1X6NXT2_PORUM|nr:hypothetical protein BU14_0352s0006 [Porphyra umbilicalis]|eukprot:OSX73387.1 hypothetical protein BU14_0352s0006 [Porphyra umbilicalis]